MVPDELRYTAEHEWVAPAAGGAVRVGITHFAQDALGDIVYVQLPEVGASFGAGEPLGEVESTKSVSEIYAPLAGAITASNDKLADAPDLINADPYGEGWLIEIQVEPDALAGLLDAEAYRKLIAG
ncbi:glycine cleavage system protein GcvH [Pilimelia columellifera]|uniref:Glycine cleavage system H protein n=1 Tax=Pilimelia columellifera subsp. columellifera TaxID=706583 RepID=A0ABP6AZN7_9ACTN